MLDDLTSLRAPSWVSRPIGTDRMDQVNLWAIYVAGYRLNPLASPMLLGRAERTFEVTSLLTRGKTAVEILLDDDPFQFSERLQGALKLLLDDLDYLLK